MALCAVFHEKSDGGVNLPPYGTWRGQITFFKDGGDGGTYPLLRGDGTWSFGQAESCNLRLKRPGVADRHCQIQIVSSGDTGDYYFTIEPYGPTYLNGTPLPSTPSKKPKGRKLRHGDIITIPTTHGRQFRIEYPQGHTMRRRSKRMSLSAKETPKVVIPKVDTPKTGSIRKPIEMVSFIK